MLGLRHLRPQFGQFRIEQNRGVILAARLLPDRVREAEELRPGFPSANPVQRVETAELLKIVFEGVPVVLYELEDPSDPPSTSSTPGPSMCL